MISPCKSLLDCNVFNNNNNDDDDDDDDDDGDDDDDDDDDNNARWTMGKGKRRERGLIPLPIVPSALSFFFLPSLPTTQNGVLATTMATIAKTSLLK